MKADAPASERIGRLVASAFDRVAPFYDDARLQRIVYKPVQDQVLGVLEKLGPARVLDVGCGTGILTTRVSEVLGPARIIGCDRSRGMLTRASAGCDNVEWIEGSAEAIPLADGAVDAVITTTAFHFFDQPRALREFARVLDGGGSALVAAMTTRTRATSVLSAPLVRTVGQRGVPSRTDLVQMMISAGFCDVEVLPPARGPLGLVDPMIAVWARTHPRL